MARNTTRHCRSPMTRHNSDVSSNSERKIKRGRKSFSDPLFLDSTLIFSRYFSAPISSRISSHAWLITTRKIYVQLIGRFKIIIRSSNLSFLANIRVNIFPSPQCKRYSTSLSDGSRHRDGALFTYEIYMPFSPFPSRFFWQISKKIKRFGIVRRARSPGKFARSTRII